MSAEVGGVRKLGEVGRLGGVGRLVKWGYWVG